VSFIGRVRKWKRKWVTAGPGPSAEVSHSGGLQVLRWQPTGERTETLTGPRRPDLVLLPIDHVVVKRVDAEGDSATPDGVPATADAAPPTKDPGAPVVVSPTAPAAIPAGVNRTDTSSPDTPALAATDDAPASAPRPLIVRLQSGGQGAGSPSVLSSPAVSHTPVASGAPAPSGTGKGEAATVPEPHTVAGAAAAADDSVTFMDIPDHDGTRSGNVGGGDGGGGGGGDGGDGDGH